jgi:hypothetical protein
MLAEVIMDRNEAVNKTVLEYDSAVAKFPSFNSAHEGYAVIKEELDELWDAIKGNMRPETLADEAKQVAAMALRFLTDCC